jgi:plasmid maintenance system antidote protein VapI
MINIKNLRSFHKRAKELKKQLGSGKEAWIQVESEYLESEGKNRYKNYRSFRINHFNCCKEYFTDKK